MIAPNSAAVGGSTVRATPHTATTAATPSTTDGRRIATSLGPPVSSELTGASQWKKGGFGANVTPCSEVRLGGDQYAIATMIKTSQHSLGLTFVEACVH